MKILAVDTATNSLSIAVTDNDQLVSELTLIRRASHSKHIQDAISQVIENTGGCITDIDGFAVSRGPGSFTGLRIGVSAVKGLAYANRKPVVSISALDILASPFFEASGLVCPMIDARRGEVYYSFYKFEDGSFLRKSPEKVDTPEKMIETIDEPTLFVGNGQIVYRQLIEEKYKQKALFAPFEMNYIRASVLARMALGRFKDGDVDNINDFSPRYIRKSDAELNFRK